MLSNRALKIQVVKNPKGDAAQDKTQETLDREKQEAIRGFVDYVMVKALVSAAVITGLVTVSNVIVKSTPHR